MYKSPHKTYIIIITYISHHDDGDDEADKHQHKTHDHLVRRHPARDVLDRLLRRSKVRIHALHVGVGVLHLLRLALELDVGLRPDLLHPRHQLRPPVDGRGGLVLDLLGLFYRCILRGHLLLALPFLRLGALHELLLLFRRLERLKLRCEFGDCRIVNFAFRFIISVCCSSGFFQNFSKLNSKTLQYILASTESILQVRKLETTERYSTPIAP
mmetsp:Transcript_40194/g.107776  ORF Transcript_40194/g.107776 Transcript_40194/m.107776 type:complete len:213 (-) Transcript_40194:240-878(-)